MLLIPMLYLPPLSYMALIQALGEVCIEAQENYIKSTYRNRCGIMGANGPIDLSIPLTGGRDHHQLYRDTQIAYASDWQHRHRMAIISSYGSAPFFEHYMPYFEQFFEKTYTHLFDLNKELLHMLIRLIKIDVAITYSTVYDKAPDGIIDLRNAFKPNREISEIVLKDKKVQLHEVRYMQVFENLPSNNSISSLDLLFNEGPQSKNILKQMVIYS
jgi:hypothetical protein